MATAEMAAPSTLRQRGGLWAGLQVEVIVATGEFSSGKSLFGLTICPGPETLVFDNEGSTTIYQNLGFRHIDMAAELSRKHSKGYSDEDRYTWWKEEAIKQGRSGNYRVLVVDPFSEIESGIARYVEKNPAKFGYSDAQFKRSSGLYWSAVKSALKADLDQLRALYETVFLTVHMRNEFKGATPTGKREPKGKETLHELASLFLLMERKKDSTGSVPSVPSAIVLKSRLAHTRINDEGEVEIVPILPPRLPQATPQAIRNYIETPPNYNRLKKDERITEELLSDDDKLLLQSQIAESNREAAESELRREELRQRQLEAQMKQLAAVVPSSDQSAQRTEKVEQNAASATEGLITAEQLSEMKQVATETFDSMAEFGTWLEENYGTARVKQLTEDQAIEACLSLSRLLAEKKTAKGRELMKDGDMEKLPPLPTEDGEARREEGNLGGAVLLNAEQIEKIRSVLKENSACILPATFAEMLSKFGKAKIADLTVDEGGEIMAELRNRIARQQDAAESIATIAESEPATEASEKESVANPAEPGSITNQQFSRVSELVQAVGWPKDRRDEYLHRLGINSFRSLSFEQANQLVEKLEGALAKFQQQGTPKN